MSRRWVAKTYGPTDVLEIETFETPLPAKDEVLIKVFATTATYTDLLIINGSYVPKFPVPVTPGYDLVGKVLAIGSAVTALKVGDLVVSMPQHGGMATEILLKESLCVKIESCTDPAKIVSIVLTGVTAHQMLHRVAGSRINSESKILVHGAAGGTGAMIVQLAKLAGVQPSNIYGTCSAKNLDMVRSLGATAVCYEAPAAGAEPTWDSDVLSGTGNRGVDVVFDAVVTDGYMSKGLRVLAPGGIYIAYGFTSSSRPGKIDVFKVLSAFLRLWLQQHIWSRADGKAALFYNVASRRDERPEEFAEDVRALAAAVEAGRLAVVVGQEHAMEGAKEALAAIEGGRHRGKQIVRVGAME